MATQPNPSEDGYVSLAKAQRAFRFPSLGVLKRYLERHKEVRQFGSSKRRRKVHAADLVEALERDPLPDWESPYQASAMEPEKGSFLKMAEREQDWGYRKSDLFYSYVEQVMPELLEEFRSYFGFELSDE